MIIALIIGMMAIGMVLLVVEVAIIPTFGVAGVAAVLCLVGGAATSWHYYGPAWGVGSLVSAALLTAAIIVIAPRTRAGKALVLDAKITDQHVSGELAALAGQRGVALTDLRPAGAVEIGGRRIDVVTDGQFVEVGAEVVVASVEGSRVVVARITKGQGD
jgi:membrane-bound serine protease (ClpP class)